MTTEREDNRDWDRHNWAGEEHPADEQSGKRWNDKEWAGEPADQIVPDSGEGEAGPTGGGHGSGEQHWAPDEEPAKD